MIKLKDTSGYPVYVNEDNVTHVAQGVDQQSKQVLLNVSIVFFTNNQAIAVQGSPDEVDSMIERQQPFAGVTQ